MNYKNCAFYPIPLSDHYFLGFGKANLSHRTNYFGIAALVQFHGIGVVCDIVNEPKIVLKNKLERLLPTLARSPHSTWINPSKISLTDFAK